MLHAVASRRIGPLYSCQAGVEVTSISHFIPSPWLFYSLHPSAYYTHRRRRYLQRDVCMVIRLLKRFWVRGCNRYTLRHAVLVITDRCSSWLNRNCLGRWLIIQTPDHRSWRFWFCSAGTLLKTLKKKSPKLSWWAAQLACGLLSGYSKYSSQTIFIIFIQELIRNARFQVSPIKSGHVF